jgi:hypothetical protein
LASALAGADVFRNVLSAAEFAAGSSLRLPPEHVERGVYVADAPLIVDGTQVMPGQLAVLAAGVEVEIRAPSAARVVMFGGAPLDGERHVWWNFVSSSRERIEQAKTDWLESLRAGRRRDGIHSVARTLRARPPRTLGDTAGGIMRHRRFS